MTSPLEAARSLRPLIESEANATDDGLTLTQPVLDAFARTHLFHILVPEAFGGLEADTDTVLDVFEELAHQDGSIGWDVMRLRGTGSFDYHVKDQFVADGSTFRLGLRNPSTVQRCFRDMFTGGRHVFVDFKSYEEIAKGKLGIA